MSAIYGLLRFGGRVTQEELDAMARPIEYWGADGGGSWCGDDAGLGQLVSHRTPESKQERGPLHLDDGTLLVAAGRLDNRDELCATLACRNDAAESAIIAEAWKRWREEAPRHLHGDWSFAVWDARSKRLFLARDPFGNTALYYHRTSDVFAFASSRKALLALAHVPNRLNELRLAQHLAFWVTDGAATLHEEIFRLPPAHQLSVTKGALDVRQYWLPEELPDVRLPSYAAYVERFLELYTAAVTTRLRSSGRIATTLSAGLDSGSVTALAQRELRKRSESLIAFTSVPLYEQTASLLPADMIDEWSLAHATAEWNGIDDHRRVDAAQTTPLAAMERSLWLHDEPEYAAGNLHWIMAMLDGARESGVRVLLSGQLGNGGVSWTGDQQRAIRGLFRGRWIDAVRGLRMWQSQRKTSLARAGWLQIVRPLMARWSRMQFRRGRREPPFSHGLISAGFASRSRIHERMRGDGYDPFHASWLEPRAQRLRILLPGLNPVGAFWDEAGAGFGLDMRDPTADVRLLEFCLGIPDHVYADATHDRLLIRRAMEGLLPPPVQWSRQRGRQGADLLFRLRADAANVDGAVRSIVQSPAAREYLDVGALRDSWARIRFVTSPSTLAESVNFARFLLFGLFVSRY